MEPPNNPMVLTARAPSLRSGTRPAAHRVAVGRTDGVLRIQSVGVAIAVKRVVS